MFDFEIFSPSTITLNSSRLMLLVVTGIQATGLMDVSGVVERVAVVAPEVVTGTVEVLLTAKKIFNNSNSHLITRTEHDL